jgi:CheY-like chemotaxis protein/HPt (histidine-containing phosphotransfer) domain-containing protein
VLVAEDNAVNARVAAAMLERLGVEAEVVGDGRAAVGRWERGDVDLILMDCRMPELDGLDATRAIRDRERGGRVPVVALTANVLTQDRDRCFAAGMDGILGKPFRQEELAEVLLRHLPAYRPPAGPARGAGGANPGRPRTVDGDKLAELRELMGPELEALVAAYLEDAEALLQRIGACVEEDGPGGDELLRLVHTLKSSSANVGARRLSEQARRLELRLRAGEPLEPAQLEGLAEIWAATRGQLQASLQPAAAP